MPKLFRKSAVFATLLAVPVLGFVACGGGPTGPDHGGGGGGGQGGGTTASVTFRSTSCACVVGQIRNFVDGVQVGSMSCNQSETYTVTVGSRQLLARDNTGSWGPTTHLFTANERQTWGLGC